MPRPHRTLALVVTLAGLAACADASRAPTDPDAASAAAASDRFRPTADRVTASARWNLHTREVIGRHPPIASNEAARIYAMVAVAQYDAVVAAEQSREHGRHPSASAAAAAASAAVLTALYPSEQSLASQELADDAEYFASFRSERHTDWEAGLAVGDSVGDAVVAYAATDGSSAKWVGPARTGDGIWKPTTLPPQGAMWGQVRPWVMTSGDQFRSATPPAPGSPQFVADLAEVHALSDAPTPEHLAIAKFWAGDFGFGGPAGYFGALATDLAASRHFNERRASRMLAVLHMAIMDASIGCYESKYAYWYFRPYQADGTVKTWVSRPNFPSYPSAHSCLSSAAAGVLTGFFPSAADSLATLVQQAGVSRIYAGLHFRFDVTAGQLLGGAVAAQALERAPRGHVAIPLD